jgi:mannose-6-phosphate isomerase-like protein (cupin superfamily)
MSRVVPKNGLQYFELKPPRLASGKDSTILVRTDLTYVDLQAVAPGGRNNLHAHTGVDGVWYVISGRGRFYTTDDKLVGEVGPGEGFLVKRNTPYWFECASDDNLVVLHVATRAQTEVNKRINYGERSAQHLAAKKPVLAES